MHRSPAPSIAPGTFFVAQPWADCITNMPGFNLRQAQVEGRVPRGIGIERLRDPPTEWSRQFDALGLNPE